MPFVATRRALLSKPAAAGGNWWEVTGQTCVAAYQAIGAASLEASYVNLAQPGTYDLTVPNTAPAFNTATGWTFGTNKYLATGIGPASTQYWTLLLRFSNGPSETASSPAGILANGKAGFFPQPFRGNTLGGRRYFQGEVVAKGNGTGVTSGVIGIAGNKAFYNGEDEGLSLGTGVDASPYPFFVGAFNSYTTLTYWDGTIQCVVFYSTTLSAPDVAALTTRMAALT